MAEQTPIEKRTSSNDTEEEQPRKSTPVPAQEEVTQPEAPQSEVPQAEALQPEAPQQELPESVRTLKDAFPDVDLEVIEAVLQSHGGNVATAFDTLLIMSDPNYVSEPTREQHPEPADDGTMPPMPPRPGQIPTEGQHFASPLEEQMRRDEELARQLALEDERQNQTYQQSQQQRQQQQQQQQDTGDDFNFEEELSAIKGKVTEAGNAAKKKVMDLYAQFKARNGSPNSQTNSSIPTTNAQYRGLPGDESDDLLTGDMSALHLSDNDVYANTARGRTQRTSESESNVIHVNPPLSHPSPQLLAKTSTSEQQLREDEELARRLANEQQESPSRTPPPMPTRTSAAVSLNHDEDPFQSGQHDQSQPSMEDASKQSKPYVIGDDDSDDHLVDADEEPTPKVSEELHKPDEKGTEEKKSPK